MNILLVEDEADLSLAIKSGLEHEGYFVDSCEDGVAANRLIARDNRRYDLIILDIMLPGMNGFELCASIRERKIQTAILALTARSSIEDKVVMLNSGADDYLTKPFSFDELVARTKALTRRPAEICSTILQAKDVVLNTGQHKVTRKGKAVSLTRKEFLLLEYLLKRPNEVVRREDIYSALWDMNDVLFSNTADVHIKNIRTKLGYRHGDFIETIRGVGYVIKA